MTLTRKQDFCGKRESTLLGIQKLRCHRSTAVNILNNEVALKLKLDKYPENSTCLHFFFFA